MKTPKAEKLPSGAWRTRVVVDGKRVSITASTKKDAEMQAMALKSGAKLEKEKPLESMTVKQAEEKYCAELEKVLSPATVAGYLRLSKNTLKYLHDIPLAKLTNKDIQKAIGDMVDKGKSPKYIKNAVSFLSTTLKKYHPSFVMKIKRPKRKKTYQRKITIAEMQQICSIVKGTNIELPVLMAMWMGMRMSEILGASTSDIKGNQLHIKTALVKNKDNKMVEKDAKTYDSDRFINIPDYIMGLIDMSKPSVVNLSASAITNKLRRLSNKNGIERFKFHELRHANASIMIRLKIDSRYAQERNGWKTDYMYKQVYGYTHDDEMQNIDASINEYIMENILLKK